MTVESQSTEQIYNSKRLEALHRTQLLDTPSESAFDRLTSMARRILSTSVVLISLVDDQRQFFKSASGLTKSLTQERGTPLSHSFCKHVVDQAQPLIIENATVHPLFCQSAAVKDYNVVAYLGVPLTTSDGFVLGTFCAIDSQPRQWTDDDISLLTDFAALTITEIELRNALNQTRVAQKAEEETKRLLQRVNDTTPLFIYIFDIVNRRPVYVNQGITHILGYSREAFLQADQQSILDLVHPDDQHLVIAHRAYTDALADGEVREVEFRAQHAAGHYCWLRRRDTVFARDIEGSVSQILGTTEDITKRKEAENALRSLADKLNRSNEALQDFVSVASHDLQEPLRKILQFGNLLQTRQTEMMTPEARAYLERILRSADRMQQLLADLLTYSRVTSRAQPFRSLALNEVTQAVLADLAPQQYRTAASVIVGDLPTIEGDPVQLRQLLYHLIENAFKFRHPDQALEIKVRASVFRNQSKDFCRLTVSDNGIGFEPRFAERIFDVFERLNERERFPGTGMGLAICRRIVERHGGTIRAEGSPNVGATFSVTLPCRQIELPPLSTDNKTSELAQSFQIGASGQLSSFALIRNVSSVLDGSPTTAPVRE